MKKLVKNILRSFDIEVLKEKPYLRRIYPYRVDKSITSLFGPSLLAIEKWGPRGGGVEDGTLKNLYQRTANSHKWRHYFPIYELVFSTMRSRPIKLLEIGVYRGASLRVWRKYFHPESTIVGADIDSSCAQFDSPNENIHVRIGEQQDRRFLDKIIKEFGPFDLIIDDGSHVTSHMIASFNALFDEGLNYGGIYFVEDLHTNYWDSHRDEKKSFIDLTKIIIDVMHAHYKDNPSESYFRLNDRNARKEFEVPRLTHLINEVRIFDSVIVFHKSARSKEPPISEHL
jgi:hypothetical protein